MTNKNFIVGDKVILTNTRTPSALSITRMRRRTGTIVAVWGYLIQVNWHDTGTRSDWHGAFRFDHVVFVNPTR